MANDKMTRADRVRAAYAKRAEHEVEKAVKAAERIRERMTMLADAAVVQGQAIADALLAAGEEQAAKYEVA